MVECTSGSLGRIKSSTAKDRNVVDKNCLLYTQCPFSISVCEVSRRGKRILLVTRELQTKVYSLAHVARFGSSRSK